MKIDTSRLYKLSKYANDTPPMYRPKPIYYDESRAYLIGSDKGEKVPDVELHTDALDDSEALPF